MLFAAPHSKRINYSFLATWCINGQCRIIFKTSEFTVLDSKGNRCAVFLPLCMFSSQRGLDIRLGYDLCPQEKHFLNKRKVVVADGFKKVLGLEKDLQDHEVCNALSGQDTDHGSKEFHIVWRGVPTCINSVLF